jgi:hypothetical protein
VRDAPQKTFASPGGSSSRPENQSRKTSRARTGGTFILNDMFRFADSLALAVAGALSAALACGQPGGARG